MSTKSADGCFSWDKEFRTPKELIEFFLWDDWFQYNLYSANQPGKGSMIFRGQSDSSWELMPSAFRPRVLERFTPQPPHFKGGSRRRAELGSQLHAEARAVYIFMEAADSLGIPTPIDYSITKESIDLILSALNEREDYDYSEPFPGARFQRATALAQHHGVPTRFLDWSESPLVALFFAAYGASSFVGPPPTEIAVIFMTTIGLSDPSSPFELVKAPRHENSNLRQQRGIFTNMRTANMFWLENGRWPSMDEMSSGRFQLQRARLPGRLADETLRLLYSFGISRHALMPSLSNAAIAFDYSRVLFGNSEAG